MNDFLRKSAERIAPITAVVALGIGGVTACASEKPDVACSPKTQIDLNKASTSVTQSDEFNAAIYQVNNAIGELTIPLSVSQAEREELAYSIENDIAANDNQSTPEIETGTVCVELNKDELGYPLKATVSKQ